MSNAILILLSALAFVALMVLLLLPRARVEREEMRKAARYWTVRQQQKGWPR